jgi:serine protease Do
MYLYGGEYNDNNKITAEIIGTCKAFDLAVLKVTGSDIVKGNTSIKAAEWYDSEEVYLGGTVFAVGNPEGDKMSVTMGVVSKDSEYITIDLEGTTDTSDDYSYRVLRTDAAINGGNSGGALYNSDGKIIGIVNAKSVSEDIDNVGYALPASTCKRVIKNILDAYQGTETHGINRAMIGVTTTISSASAVYNTTLNVTDIVENVYVVTVTAGSKFGSVLQANDVLKAIKVTDADGNVKEDLLINRQHNSIDAMLSVRAGDTVTLVINRSQEEMTFSQTYTAEDLTAYA